MKIFLYNGVKAKLIKKLSVAGWVQIEMLEGAEQGMRRGIEFSALKEV